MSPGRKTMLSYECIYGSSADNKIIRAKSKDEIIGARLILSQATYQTTYRFNIINNS